MVTVSQVDRATNAEGQPIQLAVAYDDQVHKEVWYESLFLDGPQLNSSQSKYSAYLPVYDTTTKFPPTPLFEYHDRGHQADPKKPNLFSDANIKAIKLTPRIGTEITGLQLSQLNGAQKDELALLIAERGVVVFRDQDFKDIGPEKQREFGQYFGPLHVHPVGAHIKDYIEFHSIYIGKDNLYRLGRSSSRLTTTGYHSDVSYEHQPPAITILTLVQVPETGGDTAWTSQAAAYDRLSEPFKTFLEGLKAEHSGFPQAAKAIEDGHFVRRDPVKSYHPIVRIHPVTNEKVLFINPGFTKRIIGLKEEESDTILKLLFAVSAHLTLEKDFSLTL